MHVRFKMFELPWKWQKTKVGLICALLLFSPPSWSLVSKIAFQRAALNGEIAIVEKGLSEKGFEYVNLRDKNKNTPLHLASCALKGGDKVQIIALLLKYGANVNATNRYDSTPLHIAVSTNNLEGTKLLLQHPLIQINQHSNSCFTPLVYALKNRSEDLLSLLLSHTKLDPNVGSFDGMTPLHYAAKWGYLKGAKLLLNDPRTRPCQRQVEGDFVGATPLHYAAMQAHPNLVELFLNLKNSTLNLPIEKGLYQGFTPVHFAVMNPNTFHVFKTLKLLLRAGAHFNKKTANGKLPSDLTSVRVILEFLKDPNLNYELKKRNK